MQRNNLRVLQMCKYIGKKILILGGAFQHCKVVEAARHMGIITYVADYLEESPAKHIADKNYRIDVKDVEKLSELCRKEKIDGVINTSLDPCQIPYQRLCEKMGYPCFGTRQQFRVLTNKRAFKEHCSRYGVDTIPAYNLSEIQEEQVEYPVLVKPADSRGSRGQTICNNRKEVCIAVEEAQRESAEGEILIEKYMGGYDDFTVSYLFVEGKAFLERIGDRYPGTEEYGLCNVAVAAAEPSKYYDLYMEKVHDRVIRALKGLGIKNGPVFMQGFIDGDTVRFYDPGFRFAGGEYERLLKKVTGIDVIEILVKYALDGRITENVILDHMAGLEGKRIMQLCPTIRNGKIGKIEGIEKLMKNPAVITYSPRYHAGDTVALNYDISHRFAEICLINNCLKDEVFNIRWIQKVLHVLDENGCEMICDLFDTKRLTIKNRLGYENG